MAFRAAPGAPEAERALLGAVLLGDAGDLPDLVAADLAGDRERLIWSAARSLSEAGERPDLLSVQAMLRERGELERAGGPAALSALLDGLPARQDLDVLAGRVRAAAQLRRLARVGEDLREAALQGDRGRVAELVERARRLADGPENGRRAMAEPVELAGLLTLEMTPREFVVEGFMQARDLAMIHAYRGLGKSRIAHGIGVAVSEGRAFLRWHAPRPRGVLLVDGELPREDLQKMLAQAVAARSLMHHAHDAPPNTATAHQAPRAPFRVLSADLSGEPLPSLATEAGRQLVERGLNGIELLILDSISTLCPGIGKENESESWDAMQAWLLDLRRQGVSVLLVHHDGKGGSQRGTSKREDVLSTVIQLRRPSDYTAAEGCRVELHYTKSRGLTGEAAAPFEAALTAYANGTPRWTWRPLEDAQAERMAAMYANGMTQREIAAEVGVSQSTVCRALRRVAITGTEGAHQ